MAGSSSSTAVMSAVCRGVHRMVDPWPWVLDDPYALSLVGPQWPQAQERMAAAFRPPVLRQAMAAMLGRSRYAEDVLLAGRFDQYVVLGAGLDSFAWRRPDQLRTTRMFEVDHVASQQWKRDRMAALALPQQPQHVFAPIDFETDTLRSGLEAAGFDVEVPTLFSWLGVTQYLTEPAITATLRDVRSCAPGSQVVFTYIPPGAYLDELGREFLEVTTAVAGERGEPVRTLLSPDDAELICEKDCGLSVADHLGREELHARYFIGQRDLTPPTTQRIISARVPD